MGIIIKRIESPDDIAASQTLRYRVWSEQEGVELKDNTSGRIADELDETAYHWGAFDDGKLIASARLTVHHDLGGVPNADLFADHTILFPVASMNRLVVRKDYRGQGVAKALDKLRVNFARQSGARSIVITAAKNNQNRIDSLVEAGFIRLEREGIEKWSQNLPIVALYIIL